MAWGTRLWGKIFRRTPVRPSPLFHGISHPSLTFSRNNSPRNGSIFARGPKAVSKTPKSPGSTDGKHTSTPSPALCGFSSPTASRAPRSHGRSVSALPRAPMTRTPCTRTPLRLLPPSPRSGASLAPAATPGRSQSPRGPTPIGNSRRGPRHHARPPRGVPILIRRLLATAG